MSKVVILKSCPFCGCLPSVLEDKESFKVACSAMDDCPVYAYTCLYSTRDAAVREWNRRLGSYD